MTFSLEDIKSDISALSERDFCFKYLFRSENWYFENQLGISPDDVLSAMDEFKFIISNSLGISFNCVSMVGSGKVGFSLTPTHEKLYQGFNDDPLVRKVSDIDVAIISNELYLKYWELFRKNYKYKYKAFYGDIYREIFSGYINETRIYDIEGCRKEWNELALLSKKALKDRLFIKHEINYRLYKSWNDFELYHFKSIKQIKGGNIYGSAIQ